MNILLCYDGSDISKAVIRHGKTYAKAFGGKLFLTHSMEGGPDIPKHKFEDVEIKLSELSKSIFEMDGIDCEPHLLVRGMTPGEDLVQFATEQGIDVIIIGIWKKSKLGKFIFGSTAQYVILEAPCPVISIKQ